MKGGRLSMPQVASCLLLLSSTLGCEPRNVFVPPPPPEVTVAQPVTRPVAETVDFTGVTEARQTVQLRARVTGYLKQIAFEDGANVKAGDLLFVIEPEPFEVDVESAEAALQKAEAIEQLGKLNLARALELQKDRAISKQEVDTSNSELATATANVKAAKAALKKAKLDLGYTEVRAPISGRIGRHLIDSGNLVKSEETELATIENIDPIYAYFNVSEVILLRFMTLVREHKLPDPAVSPPVIMLGLQNESGFPHQGHLDYTDLGVDPTTGTIRRRAVVPNTDHLLMPGLFVRLRSQISDPSPKLLVEERAIATDQRGAYLLVANDQNVIDYRPVELGLQVNDLRVIEKGIGKDDWVVVNGLQRARPGSRVELERTTMGGTPADTDSAPGTAAETSDDVPSAETASEPQDPSDKTLDSPPPTPSPSQAPSPEE